MFSMSFCSAFALRRWSLTARLTACFGIAVALIVGAVSAMMYAQLVHELYAQQELELREELHIQHEILRRTDDPVTPEQEVHAWSEQHEDSQQFSWQLLESDAGVAGASPAARALPPGMRTVPPNGQFVRIAEGPRQHTVLVSASVERGVRLLGMMDVSNDARVLQRYLTKLLVVLALAILASAVIGGLLVRHGLAPLRAISADIAAMGPERMHTRLAKEAWPPELRQLAESFDTLMARIATSFEQLTRFSSDLAHEFRSPMNNLVSAASVTLAMPRSVEQYQSTLEVIVEEGKRLSRMVSSMLFLARADHAKQPLQRQWLSTGVEFAKLCDFFGIAAEEKGVALQWTGEVRLHADPIMLRQAMSNLLSNALRHTGPGGQVGISANDEGATVVLRVSDTGTGIAAAHLPYVFDRFYRIDAARSAPDSSGLGLAVVRSIAELHGGTVAVLSTPGEGAVFVLTLPKGTAIRCDHAHLTEL